MKKLFLILILLNLSNILLASPNDNQKSTTNKPLIEGLGFLKIGDSERFVKQQISRTGVEVIPRGSEPGQHPSTLGWSYENLPITKNYVAPIVDLYFHENKLFMIELPNYQSFDNDALSYQAKWRFNEIITGLRDKYNFIQKPDSFEVRHPEYNENELYCNSSYSIKRVSWIIESEEKILAEYIEQKIYDINGTDEILFDSLDGNGCEQSYKTFIIYNKEINEEVKRLDNEEYNLWEIEERSREEKEKTERLKDL